MTGNRTSPWPARLSAFLVAGLCAASAVFWVLRWQPVEARQLAAPAAPTAVVVASLDPLQLAQRLGAQADVAAPQASSSTGSMQLIGVVAGANGKGSAVIVLEGKPAKSFRVGSQVTPDLVLQSVQSRKATLAPSASAPTQLTLELPTKPKTSP